VFHIGAIWSVARAFNGNSMRISNLGDTLAPLTLSVT
jgi:hypothetical protein